MRVEVLIVDERAPGGQDEPVARVLVAALRSLGLAPARLVVVPGETTEVEGALSDSLARADAVVVAGGLGPGGGGPTVVAAARLAGRGLEGGGDGGLAIPAGALRLGAEVVADQGFSLEVGGARLFCLPGDPPAMEALLEAEVLPELGRARGPAHGSVRIATHGLSAAEIAGRLSGLPLEAGRVALAVLPRSAEVLVEVQARGGSPDEAARTARELALRVAERLGPTAIHGLGGETLAEAVVSALGAVGATLATAEALAGGLVARRLVEARRGLPPLLLGLVLPEGAVPSRLLALVGEPGGPATPEPPALARALAEAARRRAGADLGLATLGSAGPSGSDGPLGLVHFALASERGARSEERRFGPMARWRVEELAATTALSLVLEWCREVKK